MCLGIAGQVVGFVDEARQIVAVDVLGARRNVQVALVEPDALAPGDWVLIHSGFAISLIDEAEARETRDLLQRLGDAYEREMERQLAEYDDEIG
jgi:hydrogenase expression/formation protein HypC